MTFKNKLGRSLTTQVTRGLKFGADGSLTLPTKSSQEKKALNMEQENIC